MKKIKKTKVVTSNNLIKCYINVNNSVIDNLSASSYFIRVVKINKYSLNFISKKCQHWDLAYYIITSIANLLRKIILIIVRRSEKLTTPYMIAVFMKN